MNYSKKQFFVLLLLILSSVTVFAKSDIEKKIIKMRFNDEIQLTANSVKVIVSVEILAEKNMIDNKKQALLTGLKNMYQSDWQLTHLDRSQDSSGLIRYKGYAVTRLNESGIEKVSTALQKMTEPGVKFNLVNTDYSPSLSEIEEGNSMLRERLYKTIQTELRRLTKQFKEKYFVERIEFNARHAGNPMRGFLIARQQQTDPVSTSLGMSVDVTFAHHIR